jgi:hypothetical protein
MATLPHPKMQYLTIILGIALIEFAAAISLAAETVTHRLPVPQVITEPCHVKLRSWRLLSRYHENGI